MTNDCVVCDGRVGCEFCPAGWTPEEDMQYVDGEWCPPGEAEDENLLESVYGVEREEPCVHGHFDCAEYEGGPCANETYARLAGGAA